MRKFLRRILNTRVPFGFFLSVVVLLLAGSVLFGWVVQHTASGLSKAGAMGDLALAIAQSPRTAIDTLHALETQIKGEPAALIVKYEPASRAGLEPVPGLEAYGISGPRQRYTAGRSRGWRILFGAYNTATGLEFGAIALDAEMKAAHFWHLDEDGIEHPKKQEDMFKFPHGFDVLPDGSVLSAFDNGVSIRRTGVCGEEIWSAVGEYHHTITVEASGEALWTLRMNDRDAQRYATRNSLVKMSVRDGSIERRMTFDEIIAANPGLDIFGMREGSWLLDPFHENDADPLPAALAPSYRRFREGDLLVSLRNNNVIFVLDPESKKVKWWRFGATRRQHDPDWNAHGTFTVFDNNTGRGSSRILEIDPETYQTRMLLDGAAYDFYSGKRGKHQILPDGSILVTSTQQARAFEVDSAGKPVFEFINYRDPDSSSAFLLSQAVWLPEDFFDFDEFPKCPGPGV